MLVFLACALAAGGRVWAQATPSQMLAQPPPGTSQIGPRLGGKSCPYGYGQYRPVGGPAGRQIVCVPQAGSNRFVGQVDYGTSALAAARCKTDQGYYACGVGASQCCAPDRNNPCFPGAFACAAGVEVVGAVRKACCISR